MNELERSRLSWLVDNTGEITMENAPACDFSDRGFCRYKATVTSGTCAVRKDSTAHLACTRKLKENEKENT